VFFTVIFALLLFDQKLPNQVVPLRMDLDLPFGS